MDALSIALGNLPVKHYAFKGWLNRKTYSPFL
jgi:hypothetical protein